MVIRDARAEDAATIALFNTAIASETEDHILDQEVLARGVDAVLSDSSKGRYWIAEVDGEIVGQIMVTYEYSDWRNGVIWWIQSVYVREDQRRTGVFSSLYRHVESLSRSDEGVAGIRLYVENSNKRAQDTYSSLGMQMRDYRIMEVDFGKEQK
jgi:ribosomal protein S18 acetylase RimI-like enzyme